VLFLLSYFPPSTKLDFGKVAFFFTDGAFASDLDFTPWIGFMPSSLIFS
jgi:hypothetical protein